MLPAVAVMPLGLPKFWITLKAEERFCILQHSTKKLLTLSILLNFGLRARCDINIVQNFQKSTNDDGSTKLLFAAWLGIRGLGITTFITTPWLLKFF